MKLDPISLLVTCPADTPLSKLERILLQGGYILGYLPAKGGGNLTLQRALDQRIPNRCALRYGEIDDICCQVKVRRGGKMILTRNLPRAATGPDFKKIFIGSRGRYGRIVEATLRIAPLPAQRKTIRITWRKGQEKQAFLRKFWASGIRPAMMKEDASGVLIQLEGMEEVVRAEVQCLKKLKLL